MVSQAAQIGRSRWRTDIVVGLDPYVSLDGDEATI
jgi:hypothetical protein